MGTMLVVVPLIGGKDLPGVGLARDQDVIESLTPDAADDPFAVGVHSRCARGTLDQIRIFGLEDGAEGLAVLVVTVAQREAQGLYARAEVGGEIPRLLYGPVSRRVGGDATDVQASGAVLEERKWRTALCRVRCRGERSRPR
jgi:hypothetical protein